jgi:hypothetical protein
VNPHKPHVHTTVISRYPASAHDHDFSSLFSPPCGRLLIPFGRWVNRAKRTCFSTPWRPRKAKIFCACSSPIPTQIKPQPKPTILCQESVHTALSTTHHTRKRPSTGPLTLRSSISPLRSALTTHIVPIQEKNKTKRNEQKSQTSDQKPKESS